MASLIKKISASTLIEVIISMVIIMAVFSVAMGIYIKIMNSGASTTSRKMQIIMRGIVETSIQNKSWGEEVLEKDSVILRKTLIPYNQQYTDLYLLKVVAETEGGKKDSIQQVIKKDED
ncbi:hypothetical protein [Rubrolithibacter danxiaensis]|uniref:hypothetical protein n=1 Tax=Rubrolithibacter danxiaensis TaxID=3390805 RepID=UPI003BF8E27A